NDTNDTNVSSSHNTSDYTENEDVSSEYTIEEKVTEDVTDQSENGNSSESDPLSEASLQEESAGDQINTNGLYPDFIGLLPLLPEHREELKTKRGFTDDIIEEFQLKSGGPHVGDAFSSLLKQHSTDELVTSGLALSVDYFGAGAFDVKINPQLTSVTSQLNGSEFSNILIPYINENGTITKIRPHKLGFKDQPAQIFCDFLVKDHPEHVVITEAEFKAIAAYQLGIPCIGLPGIWSYVREKFDDLVQFLKAHQVKSTTILFDNEIKSNPDYPNYKSDFSKRYDTQYCSYILGYKLNNAGFETKIGVLPEKWMIDGKIDLDSALAQGKQKQDFERVIAKAYTPSQYLSSLSSEAQALVRRKIKKLFFKSPIKEDFHKYYLEKKDKKGNIETEELSNFIIKVNYTMFAQDNFQDTCLRQVCFLNEYGETSSPFLMDSHNMSSATKFNEFCLSKGNYIWYGNNNQLKTLWEKIFADDSGAIVLRPAEVGQLSDDSWLFSNCLITPNGKPLLPSEDNIIWNGRVGVAVPTGDKTPSLNMDTELDIPLFLSLLKDNLGTYFGWLGAGWTVACLFSKEIFQRYQHFPILFNAGKFQSGKTTFSRWMMSLLGLETQGINISQTTEKGLMRLLMKRSGLAVWLDEFRNNTINRKHIEGFRNIYDRQPYVRAEKSNDLNIVEPKIVSCLMLSGEETPADQGLFSRCVVCLFSEKKRDSSLYERLEKMSSQLSNW
ncbi:MAG: DUF3854 domain-containing protein, partial [Planctomycetota bacterium]